MTTVAPEASTGASPSEDAQTIAVTVRANDTFASLRVPAYLRLWVAGLFSFGAFSMQTIARGFLAFDLTGLNSALGITLLGMGLPMLLMTPVGGVAADRFGKRAVMLLSTGMLFVSAAMVAVLLFSGQLRFWMLVGSAVIEGTAFALMAPARMAFSYELVGRERAANAILLAQLAMNSTRVVGPAIAGALIARGSLGPKAVYATTSTLLATSCLALLGLPPGHATGPARRRSPFADMAEGIRYVRSDPAVLWPVVMGIAVVAAAFPYVAFTPSLVKEVFHEGPGWLGALSTVSAVGAVAASLTIAKRGTARIGDTSTTLVAVAFGVMVAAQGASPSIWFVAVAVLLTGAATAAFQAMNNSLVLLRSEEEYHGRTQSLLMLGFSGFGIFAFPLGAIADWVGLRATLIGMGATTCLIVALIHLRIRAAAAAAGTDT